MTTISEVAQHIAALTMANGGATWNLIDGDLAGRPYYAVSVFPERGKVIPLGPCAEILPELPATGAALADEVERFARANQDVLVSDSHVSIGTWVHEGNVHLDLSVTVPSLQQALSLGARHGQQAVFDLQHFEDIPVPTTVAAAQAA